MILVLIFIFSYNRLRDIDEEVSDLLKLRKYVHIVDTCQVVITVALDIHDMLLPEVVAALIDVVFAILCICDIPEILILKILDHHIICLEYKVHNLVETVKDRLVEYLSMYILPLEDSSDSLARITKRLKFSDNLVHRLYLICSLLADLILGNLCQISSDLILDAVCDLFVLDELVIDRVELLRIGLIYCITDVSEAVAADLCEMDKLKLRFLKRKFRCTERTS